MLDSAYPLDDTIAAVATPPGQGGVGIVRLSGPLSLRILQHLTAKDATRPPAFTPRMLHRVWISVPDATGAREAIDESLAVHMPGPASFTGEDVAEIHCHGGQVVLFAVLAEACRLGARMAEKGEFTYRAFVNGKYDLTQAEAVAEMIAAPSRQGVRLAQAKLSGLLGSRVEELRAIVETLRAKVALAIDFPEDEAESLGLGDFIADLATVCHGIRELLSGYKRARHWREGVSVILAGRVNVGKSSLLNALLGRQRAIVSEVPGTTRDFIEESIDLDGLRVRVSDTAGLRMSADPVEMAGVARARELAGEAALVLVVVEAVKNLDDEERIFLDAYRGKALLVRNKADLLDNEARREALATAEWEGVPAAVVSARTGEGLERLVAVLRSMALASSGGDGAEPEHGDIVPNLRQSRLLASALEEMDALAEDVKDGMACDFFSVRLDAAAMSLGEITGYAATDDILGKIFSSFCIGK